MGSDQTLLTSAKQFLIEAIGNHRDRKHNFAILHTVIAVELVLKERLVMIHPLLIYEDIDAKSFNKKRTVSMNKLPQRLSNLGVQIEPKEADLIKMFAERRNQIVHHMPLFDRKAADRQFPQLLDFLAVFFRRELDTPLNKFLPRPLYRTVSGLLSEWKHFVKIATTAAQEEGSVLSEACPDCGTAGVLCLKAEDVYCHLCNTKFSYVRCTQCERQAVGRLSSLNTEYVCDRCTDDAVEGYFTMLTDFNLGK